MPLPRALGPMHSTFRLARLLAASVMILSALTLTGCADEDEGADKLADAPVETLYNKAQDAMEESDYRQASRLFDAVEQQHPYSQWATRAQLMSAFAHYQALRYDDAISGLDRFIQLHPGHPQISYAYYLRALCYYEQIADVRRDQKTTAQALEGLNDTIKRFPNTAYAKDAKQKIELARDHLAAKDMAVGRFYEDRGLYIAAIGRYKSVVDHFQTTSQTPEALHRLTECYLAMGLPEEAQKSAAVLGYNFPDSPWYKDSYAALTPGYRPDTDQAGLFERAVNSLF